MNNQQHLTLTYTRRLPPRDVEYGAFVSTDLLTGTRTKFRGGIFTYEQSGRHHGNRKGAGALMPYPGNTNLFMNLRVWLQQVPGAGAVALTPHTRRVTIVPMKIFDGPFTVV